MTILIRNINLSVSLSLTALRLVGFWTPPGLSSRARVVYNCYGFFCFVFLLGTYLIIQVVDLFLIWGNLPMMTGTAFLLFTNLAQAAKIVTIVARRQRIESILNGADHVLRSERTAEGWDLIKRCNRETILQQLLYLGLTVVTTVGWASSAEKNQLPLRAWYPYDTYKSPAYELTYFHQVFALFVAAYLNVGKDTLVTAMIAQCRCRLKLLGLSLRSLCHGMDTDGKKFLTPLREKIVSTRLRHCVERHQAALHTVVQLQACFSEPIFAQFTVSLVIICVTAFQLVSQVGNIVRLLSMGTYLLNMMFQVFLYCYQGNQLSEESAAIANAAYECPWHMCGVRDRRSILVVMTRCRRAARITAGSFTTLTLASFMAIIKASYSLFTLLQQVEEKKE